MSIGRRKQVVPLSGDSRRLEALIDIILRCHPMSLRILAGEYEPTTDELSEILECLSQGEIDIPRGAVGFCGSSEEEARVIRAEAFGGVLRKIGGWSGLAAATRKFAEAYPKTWAIVEDHVTWVAGRSFSRLDEPQIERIASMYGVSTDTIYRYRREFPGHLAVLALQGGGGGNDSLHPWPGGETDSPPIPRGAPSEILTVPPGGFP